MTNTEFIFRPASHTDLDAINSVIEAAVMGWRLPVRVKRLSLSVYRYSRTDIEHMQVVVAEQPGAGIVGVSACETADRQDVPEGRSALLLHGIYILPEAQNKGIGSELVRRALQLASDSNKDGLLVRAQPDATGFFQSCGMKRLPNDPATARYEHRYWMEAG